ncbi:hypothetical protein Tco_0227342 [Tanacetum coccineum]
MFKVFNRCLTTRTSGHDQTKINILQIFHAVINRVHVDYARLLWWDFIHCRLEENYHAIKDDIPLVSMYTTGNVTIRGMLIPCEFIFDDICATMEYKEYEKVFIGIDVSMIQAQPVESTQGTNRTPKATRTPTPTNEHKTALAAEAQENIAKVQEKILEEDIEKMVDGEDEDSYASAFADSLFQDEEDTRTRIEPGSHKENPEVVDDDDVDDNVDKQKKDDDVNDDVGKEKKDEEKDDDDKDDEKETIDNYLYQGQMKEMSDTLNNLVPELVVEKTNELMREAIPSMVNDAVKKDREIFADVVHELVSNEVVTHAPKIIEELFKLHMKKKFLMLKLLIQKCEMFSRRNSRSLLHQPVPTKFMMHIKANNGPPKGEKWAKSQKISKSQ